MTEQGELFPELLPAGAVAAPQHEAASVLLEGLPDKATCTVRTARCSRRTRAGRTRPRASMRARSSVPRAPTTRREPSFSRWRSFA